MRNLRRIMVIGNVIFSINFELPITKWSISDKPILARLSQYLFSFMVEVLLKVLAVNMMVEQSLPWLALS